MAGATARLDAQSNPMTFASAVTTGGVGLLIVSSPIVGASTGAVYGAAKFAGFDKRIQRYRVPILFAAGTAVEYNAAYHAGRNK